MKTIRLIGKSKTGKTSTIEALIREFTRRGYRVGTIKEVRHHPLKIDREGTNTDRHRKAGADPVAARGENETVLFYNRRLSVEEILAHCDADFVFLEGDNGCHCPAILTGASEADLEERMDERVFAVSGVISRELATYGGLPVIDGLTETARLADLILERAGEARRTRRSRGCGGAEQR